jgi:hypothetical protein
VSFRQGCNSLFIEGKALNQQVTVTAAGRDQYRRLIAKIEVGGEELNTELLKAGLAWWFYHYSDELDLAALEAESKTNRRGLFASDTPIYPRIWRRGARLNGGGGSSNNSGSVEGNVVILAALPNPAGTDAGNETVILGNQANDDQDLTRWKLTDDDGGSFALDGLSIPARGSLTVTLDSGLQLGNRGDEITLRDSGNQAVSVLTYTEAENGRFVYR